jgi:hypothetical protein
MAHEQLSWAIVKSPKSSMQDNLIHLAILTPITLSLFYLTVRSINNIESAEKTILIIFFGFLAITLTLTFSFMWHRISTAKGSSITTYDLDETQLIINQNRKLALSDLDRSTTLDLIRNRLKPLKDWNTEHPSDGKPLLLSLIFGGLPVEISFSKDYDLEKLLKALNQYLTE